MKIHRILSTILTLLITVSAVGQQPAYKMHKYAPNNGGILSNISPDGKWAVINLGTTASGMVCSSELYNVDTEKHFTVSYNGRELSFNSVSNEDAEGYVTIVGSFSNRPMAYKFKPAQPTVTGTLKVFANKLNWASGTLTQVTPDGKYAVGHFTQYTGKEVVGAELNGDYWFDGLFADIETGQILETPGTPTGDRNGRDQHAMKFTAITPDGKYILGEREWYMPSEGFPFVYDVEKQDFRPIGFTRNGNRMTPQSGIEYIDFPIMSPNGRYVGGLAICYDGSTESATESKNPFRYDLQTDQITIFNDAESANIGVGCIDDNGTIFGNPETGTPLRHGRIFYQDKFWIPLMQLYQQVYGFNYTKETDFEFSGTAISVSSDGSRFVAFADPQGESYCFDFGTTVEEACSHFDLLSSYTVNPSSGSIFSRITSVEVNFGRAITILGRGNTHAHLYKKGKNGANDTLVRDGLTTESGLQLKQGSSTVLTVTFRPVTMEDGEDYYIVLDEGAVGVAAEPSMVNKRIVVEYKGRKDEPVKLLKVAPDENSELDHFDPSTSYVLLNFDCPVKLTDKYEAYIRRADDGVHVAALSMASGNIESTLNQIRLSPTSTVYLYADVQYEVVVSAGSICDYAESATSMNQEIVLKYTGTYIRETSTGNILFSDNFNDPNASLSKWLNYEGDHRTPLAEQQSWGFDADNTPWNFSTHDSSEDPEYYATSHSLYAPSGQSDDWMLTSHISIPEDGKAVLTFDAQKWKNKEDHLWVYVIPEERNVSYLNNANMAVLKAEAVLLEEISDLNYSTDGKSAGHWKRYQYNLADYAGKDVYIAFANLNTNQSCVLVDNVSIEREVVYAIGFSNEERVVDAKEVAIKGTFTIKAKDFSSGAITLTLKDEQGNEVSNISWPNISGTSVIDRPIPMNFAQPLPLTVGRENKFSIDILFDGKDKNGGTYKRSETYNGSIYDLAFKPLRRVLLEEMTGTTCPNCPQGHIVIELCEKQYKDQFIPISIHAYDGDELGAEFRSYAQFLELSGAPSARINRVPGAFFPMYGDGTNMFYDMAEQNLWYNIVAQELNKPALCDLNVSAKLSADQTSITYDANLKYAINTKQQVSLLIVVVEDGIESYQENNFASLDLPILGEWGVGGIFGNYYAWPVIHNDVVRNVIGDTFSGSIGMFPSEFEAGKVYQTDSYQCRVSPSVIDATKQKVVAVLIDTQSGEVINAAVCGMNSSSEDSIDDIMITDQEDATYYDLSGRKVGKPAHPGIYISGSKKILK